MMSVIKKLSKNVSIKCLKLFGNKQKKVECKECEKTLYLKCIDLTNNQHQDYCKSISGFDRKYCSEY